jgi:hypothetical protein
LQDTTLDILQDTTTLDNSVMVFESMTTEEQEEEEEKEEDEEEKYFQVFLPNGIKKYCWVNAPLQLILSLVIERIHIDTFSNNDNNNLAINSEMCSNYLESANQLLLQKRDLLPTGLQQQYSILESLMNLFEQNKTITNREVKNGIRSLVAIRTKQVNEAMNEIIIRWYVSSVVLSFLQVAFSGRGRNSSSLESPLPYSYARRLILLQYLWLNGSNLFDIDILNSYFMEYQVADDFITLLMSSFGPYLPHGRVVQDLHLPHGRVVPDLRLEIKKKCDSCKGESLEMDSSIDAGFYPDFIEDRKLDLTPKNVTFSESDCCSAEYERTATWVMESSSALVVTRQQLAAYDRESKKLIMIPAYVGPSGVGPSGETMISTTTVSFEVVATLLWHGDFSQPDTGHYTCVRPGTNHSLITYSYLTSKIIN